MKKKLIFLLVVLSFTSYSQNNNKEFAHYSHTFSNKIFFDYYYEAKEKDSLYNITIYYQAPNYFFKFLKDDSLFTNQYEVNFIIYEDSGDFINEIYNRNTIQEKNYSETIQENIYYIEKETFQLPPGKYRIIFKLSDMKSDRKFEKEFKMKIPEIKNNGELLSSFLFSIKTQRKPKEIVLLPNISRVYHLSSDILYIEYSLFGAIDDIKKGSIQYAIYHTKDSSIVKSENRNINELLRKENLDSSSLKFLIRDSISIKNIKTENNLLMITYTRTDGEKITRQKNFWIMKSPGMMDMDYKKHIRLLSYIANSQEMDSLEAMKDGNEISQINAIERFWKNRDKDPETIENEERTYFYQKVEYANKNFRVGRYRAGWETDMGRIFITYGPPDHIEKHEYNRSGKPYQVWYYNNLSKSFIFVDYTGFGEYELVPGTIIDY